MRPAAARWLLLLGLVASLEALTRLGAVSPIFLARPSAIAQVGWERLMAGELARLLAITMYEVAVAFAAASFLGLALGYMLWRWPKVGQGYDALLGAIFASPLILLYPIFLVLFGRTTTAIIVMSAIYGMIPISLNTHQGLRDVSAIYIKVGRSLNLSSGKIMRYILFPAAGPVIAGGLKLGLTYILISTIAVEFLVEIGGIGVLASRGYFWFNTEELYIGVVSAILLSMVFIFLLGRWRIRPISS